MLEEKIVLDPPPFETEQYVSYEFLVSRVYVQSEQAAEALKKPCGLYVTIDTGSLDKLVDFENASACLAEQLLPLLSPFFGKTLLVCGIGNRNEAHDSLGPEVMRRILPKMYEAFPLKANFEKIATICPDVSRHTNLSTQTIIGGIASQIDAACILTIDACVCHDVERLCSTIQLSDSGMQTYTETAHLRQSTLGIPTISIAVPTTINTKDLTKQDEFSSELFLTSVHISDVMNTASFVIACAITQIAYPELDYESCKTYIGLFLNGIA